MYLYQQLAFIQYDHTQTVILLTILALLSIVVWIIALLSILIRFTFIVVHKWQGRQHPPLPAAPAETAHESH